MRSNVARCSVLVLSEDSGRGAHDTVAALAKKMFLLIEPACQTQRVRFEPPANEGARQALRGNLWKSREPRDQPRRRDLIGYIATKLFEGPTSFVLFHLDGDCPFSAMGAEPRVHGSSRSDGGERSGDDPAVGSEIQNVRKFRQFIEQEVLQFVEHRRRAVEASRTGQSARARPGAGGPADPGREMATTVDRLMECPALVAALRSTAVS